MKGQLALWSKSLESPLRKWASPSIEDYLVHDMEPREGVGYSLSTRVRESGSAVDEKESKCCLLPLPLLLGVVDDRKHHSRNTDAGERVHRLCTWLKPRGGTLIGQSPELIFCLM